MSVIEGPGQGTTVTAKVVDADDFVRRGMGLARDAVTDAPPWAIRAAQIAYQEGANDALELNESGRIELINARMEIERLRNANERMQTLIDQNERIIYALDGIGNAIRGRR